MTHLVRSIINFNLLRVACVCVCTYVHMFVYKIE